MLGPQLAALRFAGKAAARRAKWGAIGGLLLFTGVVFLGIALWITLENQYGAFATALVLGVILVVLGLMAFAFSKYPPRVVPRETAAELRNPMQSPALSTAAIVNAVVMGIAAGRAVRRRK